MNIQLMEDDMPGTETAAFRFTLTNRDVQFLTVILKGSKVQDPDVVYYDSILLGHLIKNVIKDVSARPSRRFVR